LPREPAAELVDDGRHRRRVAPVDRHVGRERARRDRRQGRLAVEPQALRREVQVAAVDVALQVAVGERREGERRPVARQVLGPQAGGVQPQEVLCRLHAQRVRERHVLALDQRFERQAVVEELGRSAAERDPVERRVPGQQPRIDRRGRVLGLQLAHLPLAREEPQRVADLGAQAAREVL
jgi:hypothetical protein